MDERYLAFAGVAAVLTITPVADMALVARNVFTLAGGGVRRGIEAVTGGLLMALGAKLVFAKR